MLQGLPELKLGSSGALLLGLKVRPREATKDAKVASPLLWVIVPNEPYMANGTVSYLPRDPKSRAVLDKADILTVLGPDGGRTATPVQLRLLSASI